MSNKRRRVPQIEKAFRRYLSEEDSAGFIRSVSSQYSEPTLQRLVLEGRRGTRRAAVMSLGFFGTFRSNSVLGKALHDRDRAVRLLAENGIHSIWRRAVGENMYREIRVVEWLNYSHRYEDASHKSILMTEAAPFFAEAWNQSALAHFGLGDFDASIADCQRTIELNPYHFLAASGMGHCYLKKNDPSQALSYFQLALELNPGLEGVRAQIDRLQRTLG